jgi:CRP/FNR family transcriptional regulator, anaerobic regulatory protein
MISTSFISFLADITELSSAFTTDLSLLFKEEKYKAHQIIHSAGQVENRFWYLESGFARTYYFDQTGKEHTLSFFTEKQLIFSYKGYWREATDYYLEIVVDSRLISVSYDAVSILSQKFEETKFLIHVFKRQLYYNDLNKSRLIALAAEERYLQFRKSNPEIFKIASVKLIASFLNMTRENLSRLIGKDM